jgi:hypothetical protein
MASIHQLEFGIPAAARSPLGFGRQDLAVNLKTGAGYITPADSPQRVRTAAAATSGSGSSTARLIRK